MQTIQCVIQGEGQDCLYLYGPTGTGKTHLLQAACDEVTDRGGVSVYLPLTDMRRHSTELVEGMDSLDLVCLDDIHSVAGDEHWEHALFSLYNRLQESQTPLLISGNSLPTALRLRLNDLVSRLNWGGVFALQPLDQAEQRLALQQHAASRGLALPPAVANYLLRHCDPDLKSLIGWLEYLDQASLAAKRRLTLPFVRTLFNRDVVGGC